MIKTSASLLACDLADISGELSRCKAANVDWIHFDVMDGAFVDQITYGSPVLKCVRRATDMFLDVHLMVNDPASQIKFFAEAGADLISFHLESRSDARKTLELIRSFGVKSALAVKPGTPIRALRSFAGDSIDIEVDGGINGKTAPLVKEAGANVLVAGTGLFKAEDMAQVNSLLKAPQKGQA